ncbi:hypothetical protein KKA15_01985 [Patescibacteria group bacterium]|nr:hypothetical protein [Patescibacteria group bacterium]
MKSTFNFKGQHSCKAAAIMCVDFRFWKETSNFFQDDLELKDFDLWTAPGAAKSILDETFFGIIKKKIKAVSVGLHQIKKIVLVNHADCGAYGGRDAFSSTEVEKNSHKQDLMQAKKKLQAEFPDLEIVIAYADLDQKGLEVNIVTVE